MIGNLIEKINTSVHERRELKKRKRLSKKVMKQLSIPKRTTYQQHLLLLRDVALMNEDLLDLMLAAEYKSIDDWCNILNSHFAFEQQAYEYPYELKYTIGQVHETIKLILIRHEVLALQDKIFNNT